MGIRSVRVCRVGRPRATAAAPRAAIRCASPCSRDPSENRLSRLPCFRHRGAGAGVDERDGSTYHPPADCPSRSPAYAASVTLLAADPASARAGCFR